MDEVKKYVKESYYEELLVDFDGWTVKNLELEATIYTFEDPCQP